MVIITTRLRELTWLDDSDELLERLRDDGAREHAAGAQQDVVRIYS